MPAALIDCCQSPEAGHADFACEKSQQEAVSEENYQAAAQVLQAFMRGKRGKDVRSELAVLEEPQVAAAVLQAETGSQQESDKSKEGGNEEENH